MKIMTLQLLLQHIIMLEQEEGEYDRLQAEESGHNEVVLRLLLILSMVVVLVLVEDQDMVDMELAGIVRCDQKEDSTLQAHLV